MIACYTRIYLCSCTRTGTTCSTNTRLRHRCASTRRLTTHQIPSAGDTCTNLFIGIYYGYMPSPVSSQIFMSVCALSTCMSVCLSLCMSVCLAIWENSECVGLYFGDLFAGPQRILPTGCNILRPSTLLRQNLMKARMCTPV